MSQSLSQIYIHAIFSVKNRTRALAYPELRKDLNAYSAGVMKSVGSNALIVGAVIDHMHILFKLSRTDTISKVISTLKSSTSAWIKEQKCDVKDPYLMKFSWQSGYGAFSVSASKVDIVRKYIENQEEHHKRVTFQDEYREFLGKYDIEYDEKYVWD